MLVRLYHSFGAWSFILIAGSGCLQKDPLHCSNRGGDTACAMQDLVCSRCSAENQGCVPEPQDLRCRVDVEAGSTTVLPDDDDSGSDETTTSVEPPMAECERPGLSDACSDPTPYCIDTRCSTCPAGDADFCATTVSNQTPVCHADWGRCVGCVSDSDCNDGACNTDLTCVECFEHDQCASGACDLRLNRCFQTVTYVNNIDCEEPGFGTAEQPWCTLATAVVDLPSNTRRAVRVSGGPYVETLTFAGATDRTLAIIGDGTVDLYGGDHVIALHESSYLFVHGVSLQGGTTATLDCTDGGRVWIDDSVLSFGAFGGHGLQANACDIVARRTSIRRNSGDGIRLSGASKLRLESSLVAANGTPVDPTHAITSLGSELDIVYSTFAGNRGLPTGSSTTRATNFLCSGSVPRTVRNSLIVSETGQSIDCPGLSVQQSIIDTPGFGGADVQIVATQSPAWFVNLNEGDAHIADGATLPFGDVGRWQLGDPRKDIDGDLIAHTPGDATPVGGDQP